MFYCVVTVSFLTVTGLSLGAPTISFTLTLNKCFSSIYKGLIGGYKIQHVNLYTYAMNAVHLLYHSVDTEWKLIREILNGIMLN